MVSILALNTAGVPLDWLTLNDAASYYATGQVAWEMGADGFVLHGGLSRKTGNRSEIRASSIIAIKGSEYHGLSMTAPKLPKTGHGRNRSLFLRDRHMCAYCGDVLTPDKLEREHVFPLSRKGPDVWTNCVTACTYCNGKKAARTPEEAKMPLLYVPYTPNRFEHFILTGRTILADQMEFLLQKVPKHSRLLD